MEPRKLKDYVKNEVADLPKGTVLASETTPPGWQFFGYVPAPVTIGDGPIEKIRLIEYVGK